MFSAQPVMHEPRYATTTTVVETTEYMAPDDSPTYAVRKPCVEEKERC